MQKNVGGYDRLARLTLGPILLLVAAATFGGYVTIASGLLGAAIVWAALLVGAVFVVTGATQVCPINSLLGIDTFRGRSAESSEDRDDTGRPA